MKYYSLTNHEIVVSFREAAIQGIAPDKGLYFPMTIPKLPTAFFEALPSLSVEEIGYQVIQPFIGDALNESELRRIVQETLDFPFPLIPIEQDIHILELFQGPTLAFKDVGARFMARCLQTFVKDKKEKVTILVATSGDTGGAVANGFYDVEGIEVVILYPSGKVSSIQEKQLTTLGKNIKAIEVKGNFDDCQAMVKSAFLDKDLKECNLTSANSINIARWLPQMFYYFLMYQQLGKKNKPLVVSVPSGNFGNICAGIMAREMGLPIDCFVAATNSNDTIVRYMNTKVYQPQRTQETISNAMDVSDPSNFVRILEIADHQQFVLEDVLKAYTFSDEDTRKTIEQVYQQTKYILDPHGAVGYLGLQAHAKEGGDFTGVFLGTAHPVKFPECIEEVLGIEIPIPDRLQDVYKGDKQTISIEEYEQLKDFLLQ